MNARIAGTRRSFAPGRRAGASGAIGPARRAPATLSARGDLDHDVPAWSSAPDSRCDGRARPAPTGKEAAMTVMGRGRLVGPHAGLLDWLAGHGVEYELHEHPLTFTARETAEIEGVDPRRFAKTVAVETEAGERALVVVDAVDHVDLAKAARSLRAERVRLLSETEMVEFAPDCEPGTIPPVGELLSVRLVADLAVREDPEITFHAGSHHFTVHVDRAGWERGGRVVYADVAEARERGPAWAR
jgi:Ala-tRNA(Pro) deacylase